MRFGGRAKADAGSVRCPWGRLLSAAASMLLFLNFAYACGGTSAPGNASSPSAGSGGLGGAAQNQEGTQNQGGSAASMACPTGETRECVGPAACRGGQVCGSGAWSACACGSGGAPQGGTEGVGGSDAGGVAGAAGVAGAENGGAPPESADPCPTPNANASLPPWTCATDCFAQRKIDNIICGYPQFYPTPCTNYDPTFGGIINLPQSITAGEILVRTPGAATVGGPCACAKGVPIVAKLLFDAVPNDAWPYKFGQYHIRVTVRPPWHVGLVNDTVDCAAADPAQCENLANVGVQGGNRSNLQIWTEDPAAPPVNVEMAPGDCPK